MYITGSGISKQPGFEIQWFLGGWIRDMLEMLGQSKFGIVGILRDSVGISVYHLLDADDETLHEGLKYQWLFLWAVVV